MKPEDSKEFARVVNAAYAYIDKEPLGAVGMRMFFQLMEDVSIEEFRRAMTAHLNDPEGGRFAPKAAHIRAQLAKMSEADGRPCADEAWAIALRMADESQTVVRTVEIAKAFADAMEVLASGDKTGARMAFRAAYERHVSDARQSRTPVSWDVSLGHDPTLRNDAIADGIARGLLPAQKSALLLSVAEIPPGTQSGNALSAAGNPVFSHDFGKDEERERRENLKRAKAIKSVFDQKLYKYRETGRAQIETPAAPNTPEMQKRLNATLAAMGGRA